MKVVVAAFNQEKVLVGAFSVITNLRMELFEALVCTCPLSTGGVRSLFVWFLYVPAGRSLPIPPIIFLTSLAAPSSVIS